MTSVLTDDLTKTDVTANEGIKVDQTQTKADWQTSIEWPKDLDVSGKKPANGSSKEYWTVKWDATNSKVVVG